MCDAVGADDGRALAASRIAICVLFFVGGAGWGVWATYIPVLKAGLALDAAQVGIVLLCVAIGCICGMPAAGLVRPQLGAVRSVILAGVAFPCSVAGPSLASSYPTLAVAGFFIGVTFGFLDVCMNANASAIEQALGRPILSSVHAFFSIGNLGGALGGSVLIGAGLAPSTGLGISTLVLVALTFAATPWLWLPSSHVREAQSTRIFQMPTPAILGIGGLTVMSFIIELGMIDWGAVFLVQATAASPAVAAYGLAAFSIAMTAGRFTGDRVVNSLGGTATVQLSGILAAIGIGIVAMAPDPWTALPGFALAGLGIANLVPVLFSASGRVPGVAPAAGIAMAVTMAYGGGLFGPPLIGFVADTFGMRAAIGVLAVGAMGITLAARGAIPQAARN